MKWILLILLASAGLNLQAQSTLSAPWADRYRESSSQWMLAELRMDYPSYFRQCPSGFNWEISAYQNNLLPGWTISSERAEVIDEVFVRLSGCSRLLELKALADLYFPLFEKKLREKGLPTDYAFLPFALTGLNPHYRDKADRAGIWAMDYFAARKQGLRIDERVDERCGGDFTADAAIRHLADLHKNMDSDPVRVILAWTNSAAYARSLAPGLSGRALYEQLNREDQFLIDLVVHCAGRIRGLNTENQLSNLFDIFSEYESVFFTREVQVAAIEAVLGVSPERFYQVNPVYKGDRIESDYRKVAIMLPLKAVEKLKVAEDSLYNWTPPRPVEPEITEEHKYHTVRRGETLGRIAEKYHVSVSQLKKWNKLRSDRIRAGQRLVIIREVKKPKPPAPTPVVTPDSSSSSNPAPDSAAAAQPPPVQEKKPDVKQPAAIPKKEIWYTVRSGDSLWSIAKKYPGVTPEKIMKWNKCGEKIRPGQKLRIELNK